MLQCSDIEMSNFTSVANLNSEGLILSLKSKRYFFCVDIVTNTSNKHLRIEMTGIR